MRMIKNIVLLFVLTLNSYSIEMEFEIENAFEKGALPSSLIKAVNAAYDLNMKGLDALDKGKLDVALSLFDEALTILADYPDALNNKGVVFYYRKGNTAAAREIWEKLSVRIRQMRVIIQFGLLTLTRSVLAASRL